MNIYIQNTLKYKSAEVYYIVIHNKINSYVRLWYKGSEQGNN